MNLKIEAEHEAERLANAKALTERVLVSIEKFDDDKQTKIIECGLRLRELACYYGPYFSWAIALTSAEIASGDLLMPKEAECDRIDIMLPGGASAEELRKIIAPGPKH